MYIYKNKTRIVFKKLVLRFSNLFNPVLPSKLQARKCSVGSWGENTTRFYTSSRMNYRPCAFASY